MKGKGPGKTFPSQTCYIYSKGRQLMAHTYTYLVVFMPTSALHYLDLASLLS